MNLAVHPILALRIRELAIPVTMTMKMRAILLTPTMAVRKLRTLVTRGLLGFASRGGGRGVVEEGGGGHVVGEGLECGALAELASLRV